MGLELHHRASPNFNDRKTSISALVLHYTGMDTAQSAIDRLCDREAGVSAHYVVEEDGKTWSLVEESKRAWHAGAGVWRGEADMNSASIGIEIVNGGHNYGLPEFPEAQIDAVITLAQGIIQRWDIPQTGILGHSDMAPERKLDPGEKFPWHRLSLADIGFWPDVEIIPDLSTQVDMSIVKSQLRTIGYGVDDGIDFTPHTRTCVAAFQRRWRADNVTGLLDHDTRARIALIAAQST
jgi:N-acetylmuramoyl-L-alanine amidase